MAERTLYEWFANSVEKFPDELALEVANTRITYRNLHIMAMTVAREILRSNGSAPQRIALLASRSVVAFAGYLAALRLGAVVTPLNPAFPVARNRTVCDLAGVEVLLTDETCSAQSISAMSDAAPTVLTMGESDLVGECAGDDLPAYPVTGQDVAYVLFTSGSTGQPKGVPIRHRNLSPYIAHNIDRYEVGPGCRISHTFELTFDPSVFDLFVTWGSGATLIVPQRTALLTPIDYIADNGITHWFSVPSVISVSAELGNLPTGMINSLRYSVFIGEALTLSQANAWRAAAPESIIENVYGPTELTVACTEYRLPREPMQWPSTSNGTVPIGPVYDFLDFVVLDEHGRAADEGELCVRGVQRFDGYLDERDNCDRFISYDAHGATRYDGTSELTDAHYYRTGDRVRLESGHWIHLGRWDHQVKIRGFRVELGEIEAAMRRHTQVREAIVVAAARGDDIQLFGYYTGSPLPASDLRRWLRRQVPLHMVPHRITHLAEIPLNANGKADRRQLHDLLINLEDPCLSSVT